jgi:hypothetical protein
VLDDGNVIKLDDGSLWEVGSEMIPVRFDPQRGRGQDGEHTARGGQLKTLCVVSCWALTPTMDVSAGALAAVKAAGGISALTPIICP